MIYIIKKINKCHPGNITDVKTTSNQGFYYWYVMSRYDLDSWPFTLKVCSIFAVMWLNSVPDLSELEQSEVEL